MTKWKTDNEMVQLPIMSAADAVALGTALETRAREAPRPLPPSIDSALSDLGDSRKALARVAQLRLQEDSADTGRRVAADRVLDNVWGGAESWCQGFLRLPLTPQSEPFIESARILSDKLFADGLKFIQLRFRVQWFESQNRIDIIDELGLERHFEVLGGRIYLDMLREAHKEYGDALGITDRDEPVDLPSLRDALDVFRSDLRRYVVRVIAYVEPKQPATQELADDLLVPLRQWRAASSSPPRVPVDPPEGEAMEAADGSEPAEATAVPVAAGGEGPGEGND
jgi:hypothetical protein